MMDSQDDKTTSSAPNKRRRLNNQRGGSSGDDGEDDAISLYSDSSNDGGNLSSNASSTSPESANKMENTNLTTGPQQQQSSIQRKSEEATNSHSNEVLPNKSPSIDQKRGAANNNNDNTTNNDTTDDDEEEYCTTTTYRTVQVPPGITEGQLFHVLIKLPLLPDGRADDKIIGVTCPKGVKGGDTIIVVEPGSSPPLTPDQIAKINERRLLRGFDKENAKWVAISFWKIVWPLLVAEGWWCQRESLYNFGSVTFYSPAAKKIKSKEKQLQRNEQYFDSIKGVLDFIKLLPVRKSLVDMCFVDAQKRKMKSVQLAQKALATKRSYTAFDRWKYPTGMEALKHSRVGSHYQAQNLPEVWAYSRSKSYNDGCTTLEPIGNLKEHDDSSVKSTWLEWAKDDAFANEFHCKLLEAKKQFRLLAASMNKPMGFCLWYYYHKYKTSDYYVILKKLLRDNNNNESGEHLDECVICDDGGDLICCESCPNAYHLSCLGLDTIEDDKEWFCPDCTEERTKHLSPRRKNNTPSPTKTTMLVHAPGEAKASPKKLVMNEAS